jgi:hypothetical protein
MIMMKDVIILSFIDALGPHLFDSIGDHHATVPTDEAHGSVE